MYKRESSCKLQRAGRRTREHQAKFKKLFKSKSRILLFSLIWKNCRKREKTKQNKKNPKGVTVTSTVLPPPLPNLHSLLIQYSLCSLQRPLSLSLNSLSKHTKTQNQKLRLISLSLFFLSPDVAGSLSCSSSWIHKSRRQTPL